MRNTRDFYRKRRQPYNNLDDDKRFAQMKDVEALSALVAALAGTVGGVAHDVDELSTAVSAIQDEEKIKMFDLGTPVIPSDDLIVVSTNMFNGEYTIAAQPDVPRTATVTATAGDTADTLGTVTLVGTNADDEAISEVITPIAGVPVIGSKAFKSFTSITGAGWAIDETEATNDTIKIGVSGMLGLPVVIDAASDVVTGIVGEDVATCTVRVGDPATLEESTVILAAGAYNGDKRASVFVKC